jgi:hypothetical protein
LRTVVVAVEYESEVAVERLLLRAGDELTANDGDECGLDGDGSIVGEEDGAVLDSDACKVGRALVY